MTLTRAQKEYRAQKIAVKIRDRIKELGLSKAEVARRADLTSWVFDNAVLRYASREGVDVDMELRLARMSAALEWPGPYLGGLLDGSIDLSEDPANLPAKVPSVKPKWKKPSTAAREPAEALRPGSLRQDVEELTARVAELEGTVTKLAEGQEGQGTVTVDVYRARDIEPDSWLNEPRYATFRAAYDYASGRTLAMSGLSKVTPEEAFHIHSAIQRGIEKHDNADGDPNARRAQR